MTPQRLLFMAGQRKSPEIKGFRAKRKGRQFLSKLPTFFGGEGGIRTLDTLMGYTRFPIVRARPDYATSPSKIICNYAD